MDVSTLSKSQTEMETICKEKDSLDKELKIVKEENGRMHQELVDLRNKVCFGDRPLLILVHLFIAFSMCEYIWLPILKLFIWEFHSDGHHLPVFRQF